jgi:hypothetical protein
MTLEELELLLPYRNMDAAAYAKHQDFLRSLQAYIRIHGDYLAAAAVASRMGVTNRTVQRWRQVLREITGGQYGTAKVTRS